nr:reverse transcriptase domain-containing protein [Tanacetum cinerariifolium]
MTLELANRAICTLARIARDVFVLIGKFTFLTDFVIVDYKCDPRVPLILGRPFLRTARTLIDVHGEEMILYDVSGNTTSSYLDYFIEEFTDEHTLDYSSLPLYDDVDDDLVKLESYNDDVYDDLFNSKEDKLKESKLLIDELDPPRSSDFLPSLEILILLIMNFLSIKKFSGPKTLLSFSSKNEEKVFNPGILTSKGVHTSLLPELSHRGPKAFKDFLDFEDSCSWLCPSITRSSHPQLYFGNPIS